MKSADENTLQARILCVDDDVNLQKSLSFILWREGYEVFCAQTVRKALSWPGGRGLTSSFWTSCFPESTAQTLWRPEKGPNTSEILVIMVTARNGWRILSPA